jgi:heme/copper-type cytochrome/quinol oxidase subunit 2
MLYFAHDGEVHTSVQEAATHQLETSSVLSPVTIGLITGIVVFTIFLSVLLCRYSHDKKSKKPVAPKSKKK